MKMETNKEKQFYEVTISTRQGSFIAYEFEVLDKGVIFNVPYKDSTHKLFILSNATFIIREIDEDEAEGILQKQKRKEKASLPFDGLKNVI
jgi:hypothetical protein